VLDSPHNGGTMGRRKDFKTGEEYYPSWRLVTVDLDGTHYYLDETSVTFDSNTATFIVKVISPRVSETHRATRDLLKSYGKASGTLEVTLQRWLIDEARNAVRLLHLLAYDADGKLIATLSFSNPAPTSIEPMSVEEKIWKQVYALKQAMQRGSISQAGPAYLAGSLPASPMIQESSSNNVSRIVGITKRGQQPYYAGFWLRVAAFLIDCAVLFIPGVVVQLIGEAALADRFDKMVFGTLIAWGYAAFLESSEWQGTLGKRAVGIAVTDYNGKRVSFGRATGRYFGKFISGLTLMIGYFMVASTQKKQALHDIMAGTLVVTKEKL
jgi:uncharacterized RDD family membrane protein YckC